jgi:polyferredoxin
MSEWISVLDKLPDSRTPVIVWAAYWSAWPFVGHLVHGQWVGERILSEPSAVTHWMPLPDPPKDVA